jgi:chromosome segregation ATPase
MVMVSVLVGLGCVATSYAQKIFSCVDASGRRLTSDRPIPECLDREQKELSKSGTVRAVLTPPPTLAEIAAREEKIKLGLQEEARKLEQQKRDRTLLSRYPDKAAHDRVRADALSQVTEQIRSANSHIADLQVQRKKLNQEMEFYKGDLLKAPLPLRRQLDENDVKLVANQRFIVMQEETKTRINTKYDEELVKLTPLWTASASAAR